MANANTRKAGHGRSWIAGILLVIATLLLPTAIVGHWATVQISNSNEFVKTLSPLAANPAVQQIATEIFGSGVTVPKANEYVALGAARQAASLI